MSELVAVLVNYNAGSELGEALRSIADEMAGIDWEAVVVDNASTDGSDRTVEGMPRVRVVRNAGNIGFGRAVNQGIALAEAPEVLVMNPDCRLSSGAVAAMRAELSRSDRVAIVGPRVLNPDGSPQGSARGDPDMLTGLFGRTSTLRRVLPGVAASKRNVVDERVTGSPSERVDWVSGACMLIRRAAFDAVSGFDPRYFMYWEDADLCRRLRQRGYETRYVRRATAVHRVGHSSRTAQAASIRAFHESAFLYYAAHVAPSRLNPKRAVARLLLALRCQWKLRQQGQTPKRTNPRA